MAKRKSKTEFTQADDDLLAELGVEHESAPVSSNALQERVLAGFEDIQRFVQVRQRLPKNQDGSDIFERLYAVRLERLRALTDFHDLLSAMDHGGLLADSDNAANELERLSDAELLEVLGVEEEASPLTELRHVRSQAEIKATPEEIAKQQPCTDFNRFAPLFERTQSELKNGTRETRPFGVDASIREGDFFILSGQFVYVAGIGDYFKAPNGEQDARLRAIYSNGTESNLLLRSLQRALYKDETSRRLTEVGFGPLFADTMEPDDIENGYIYVLRSRSDHPYIARHRELIHKIGVTGRSIESRIAQAEQRSTYLFAPVEVIASYKLAGLNRVKLENLIHRIFAQAQLDVVLHDPFGAPMKPREWFLVPLNLIDVAILGILDGTITQQTYDPSSARFVDIREK